MTKFKLIGRTTVFRLVRRFKQTPAGIDVVQGVSECGNYETIARFADIEVLES